MSAPVRVLYANQTGQMSGAERSLLELLGALPAEVIPAVACPNGDLADAVRALGISVHELPATDLSFRPHPIHTPRGLAWIARAGASLRKLARRLDADLVHANTTRAGLAGLAARGLGAPPVVTHVRDWIPSGRGPAMVLGAVARGSAATIANSRFTAAQLPPASRPVVIHNPVDAEEFDPDRIDRAAARSAVGLSPEDDVLGVVAQITPWKGQDDAVRILAALLPERPRLRLLIAGTAKFAAASTRFDNVAFERHLRDLARDLGVEGGVRFLGERSDVARVLRATDVLLVPSWREAFGRAALEGLAMRVPVVATSVGGPAEIVRDGVDGLLLEPRDPERWARAVGDLLGDPERLDRMGASGRERARAEFSPAAHGEDVLRVYRTVLADGR